MPGECSPARIVEFLGVDRLLVHVPDTKHRDKAFSEISLEDFGTGPVPEFLPEEVWRDSGVTALWDIKTHQVLWAEKFRSRHEARRIGKTLEQWAGKRSSARRIART